MLAEKIEKLKLLVSEAETILKDEINFSKGNRNALADMVGFAKAELNGTYKLPFSNCRDFYDFNQEARTDFVTSRYTMVSTYPKAVNYTTYGLQESLDWIKGTDIRLYDDVKKQLVLETATDFANNAKIGTGISNYPQDKIDELKTAIKAFDKDDIASISALINTLKEARLSVIYRGDTTKDNYAYFGEAKLREIIDNAKEDEVLSNKINEMKEQADKHSLEHLKRLYSYTQNGIDYAECNKIDAPWSSTERRVSFCVPEKATAITVSLTLPCVDNEEDGIGHVWVDNFDVLAGNGSDLPIPCHDFSDEEIFNKYWKKITNKGEPVLKLSDEMKITGKSSLYIENPTSNDEGGFECIEKIDVVTGGWYSIDMFAKVDGKAKNGLEVKINFFDDNGEYVDCFVYNFNKKAWPLDCMEFGLLAQCCALSYYITGDKEYAEKAKYMLLIYLDNFCQGTHYWLMNQSRPGDSDCYGAVQGGRLLIVVACAYSYIRNLGVFTEEEKAKFYDMIDYQLRYMLDLRDRTELTYLEAQMYSGNWQSDMCIGTSMIMAVMEDFPNRKTWMLNAYFVLRGQIETHLNDDGSWPESIRYNNAVLKHMSVYAQHLLFETGENWFTETRFCEIYNFIVKVQTPKFSLMGDSVSTPPFGDHHLSDGSEFAHFGSFVDTIASFNKKLADEMYETWVRGNRKITGLGNENVLIESIMFNANKYKVADDFELDLKSTADFKNAGIYVFRGKNENKTDNYLAVMSSPKRIAHGHLDQGSFITYYNNTPLVMDTGIEGYFDASTMWHLSTYSHPCLMFSTKRKPVDSGTEASGLINLSAGDFSLKKGYNDTPRFSKVLDVNLGDEIDTISIEVENEEGFGKHIRNIAFTKDTGVVVLDDKLVDFEDDVLVSFPVITNNSRIEGNTVYCECLDGVTLKIEVLTPYENIEIDSGRIFRMGTGTRNLNVKSDRSVNIVDVIRIKAKGKDGVKTILTPIKEN